jgi:hypothetical protein
MTWTRCTGILALLLLSACEFGNKCSTMAFASAGAATRIDVKSNDGTLKPRQITDRRQIDAIVDFVKARTTGWYAPWYGVPVGQIRTEIYQDQKFIADFAIGRDFFEAQGCGYFYIRKASSAETRELLKLLGVDYDFK